MNGQPYTAPGPLALNGAGRIKINVCTPTPNIVQELCESRGDRPGLPVLMSLMVSVDVKLY